MSTVDDQNSAVKFSADWGRIVDPNAFNDTLTWTEVAGETATLQFTGTGVSVYGAIANIGRRGSPVSSYSIDGGSATTYTGTQTSSVQEEVLFFKSGQLDPGGHTLVVTVQANNLFYLDYFQIINAPSSSPSGSTSNPAPGATITVTQNAPSLSAQSPSVPTTLSVPLQANSSNSVGADSVTSTTNSSSSTGPATLLATVSVTVTSPGGAASDAVSLPSGHRASPHVGTIVGALLGGLLLLGMLFTFFFFRMRSRRFLHRTLLSSSNHYDGSNPALPLRQASNVMTEVATPFYPTNINPSSHSVNLSSGITVPPTNGQFFGVGSPTSASEGSSLSYISSPPINASPQKRGMTDRAMNETISGIQFAQSPFSDYDPPPQYVH